ncbi:glycoside hydrolase family 13 protein [Winogradskyella aurantiaca]|uniref:glycoside hydrolase family 13 protein n=1 Tax=Winogradskyella aurantiaca TaxID=2219558 RepID=UPI000E1CC4E8|nr:glycoside hydrolase family 13 protein [Winogradskyella aurantiaca]
MRYKIYAILVVMALLWSSCNSNESKSAANPAPEPVEEVNDINRIEPPNWWVGFENSELQILVHHPGIGEAEANLSFPGVSLNKSTKGDNSNNYLFLDLSISESTPTGRFNIDFKMPDGSVLTQTYELKSREKSAEDYVGFNSSDAIFLVTPDRFANADPNNDSVEGLQQQGIDRKDGYARHGGDIQGITDHLDYIDNLGFTAVWPCPLLTNDMPQGSYHGYAITDYYQVDPRFGTFDDYLTLSKALNSKGMKLIMDQVANHCGLGHWWMEDLPFKDWINYQENYESNRANWTWKTTMYTNHIRTTNQDIYGAQVDSDLNSDGWFVEGMPDLNQRNPYMANYIIQNSIWWIESLGLGGIRQDTYPYPDKDFMSDWAGAIMTEYPNFNIVGEEWSTNPLLIAYWQDGHENKDGYVSNLRSSMDFAMQERVVSGLKNEESWGTGLRELYESLANDFSYTRPEDILVFPDNHDMSRIFTQLDGDITNTKMALSYYSVLPRTFQMYYGTEILMDDFAQPGDHGLIRTDFPGGWDGDEVNAFTGEGLAPEKKDMQEFVSALINYRKNSKAIHEGKTLHFAPVDGVYVLTRIKGDEVVIHILNKNEDPYILELDRFAEIGADGKSFKDVLSGMEITWSGSIELPAKGSYLFTTK